MSEFKDHNFINVLGWMVTKLNLSGNKLLTFAIIYGFSQDGIQSYSGSLSYLSSALGCSKPTAKKALNDLVELDYIEKKDLYLNNVKFCEYKVNLTVVKNLYRYERNFTGGGKESLLGGGKESLPNNIYNNKDKDKDNKESLSISESNVKNAKSKVDLEKPKKKKKSYGEKKEKIKHPFSQPFDEIWNEWKDFRKKNDSFRYVSLKSEQRALEKLVKISNGIENNAIEIIHQSIDNGWKGFFELNNKNKKNEKKSATYSRGAAISKTQALFGEN